MNKYIYTQVEHLSDLDITGNTQYYLFEEGVGHEEFYLSSMVEYTLYQLGNLIEERTIFTREEKPWFERIPKKGVLCRHGWDYGYLLITDYDQDNFVVYDQRGKDYEVNVLTPLTNHEIKAFLQEEE